MAKRMDFRQARSQRCWQLLLAAAWLAYQPLATAAEPSFTPGDAAPQNAATAEVSADELRQWVQMLESDRFSQRQQATRQLSQFGQDVVEPLVRVVENGGPESTQRALGVLQRLALEQAPDDEQGAWGALHRLADRQRASTTSGASTSVAVGTQSVQATIDQLRMDRLVQAHSRLVASGVQIGVREFVIDSRSFAAEVIWIDKHWQGDVSVLRWLRWIQGIDHVLLEGAAVRQEVVEQVAKMSNLRTLVMWDASIRDDVFTPLAELNRIDQLEIRYISLGLEDADRLAKLPIRGTLGLMGTGLPVEGAMLLREALPGVRLSYKQGGFLGVTCSGLGSRCQIDSVSPGGAADRAGLAPGDVVVEIDGAAISTFEDLQLHVGSHFAGEEIQIVYDRFGEIQTTTAKLGKLGGE